MSAVEIRVGVNAVSPDGAITLFYGDLDVPVFTVPSQMLAMAGLRPGMTYNPGQGVHMLIAPYMNGQAFASEREFIADRQSTQHIGAPDTVLAGLTDLIKTTEVDELMITTQTHDPADRQHSFDLIAAAARAAL